MKAAFIPAALLCCVVGASSAPAKAKVLVVYYSQSNHTQSLAQAVADGAAQHADVVDVRGPLSIDNGKALRAALRAASPTTRPLIPVSHPRTHAYPVCFVRAFIMEGRASTVIGSRMPCSPSPRIAFAPPRVPAFLSDSRFL